MSETGRAIDISPPIGTAWMNEPVIVDMTHAVEGTTRLEVPKDDGK